MGTLIKLLIAALLVHAVYRTGTVYWRHYQFEDDVHQAVLFGERETEPELHRKVMQLAKTHSIPVAEGDVTVRRTQSRTIVAAQYMERIELLPRYFYPWQFDVDVDVLTNVQ